MNFTQLIHNANPFRQPTAAEVKTKQLEDAQRLALEHRAAAELHKAAAAGYETTIKRLKAQGVTV